MKKSVFIIPALIIIACAPQATVTLTPSSETPTKVKPPTVVFSATPDETQAPPDPEIIERDSELNKIGIPEGATLGADENGAPIYYVTNPAGEQVIVGQKDASGNWEPGDAARYTLFATREEAMSNPLPLDYVMRAGPGEAAKLTGEPFPENVITGLNVEVYTPENVPYKALRFDAESQSILRNHPGQEPFNFKGWFSFDRENGKMGLGVVWQWANPDESIVYITVIGSAKVESIRVITPFVSFDLSEEAPSEIANITGMDPEITKLVYQWAETDILPKALQEKALGIHWVFPPGWY